jgi:hypothetical protein
MIRGHKQVRGNYINHNATNTAMLDDRIVIIPLVEPEGARPYKAKKNFTLSR